MSGFSNRIGQLEIDMFIGLALKGGGAAASLAVNLLLARTAGAAGVGIYQIALTTASLFGVIAVLGLDTVLIRAVAVAWHREDCGSVNGSIRRSLRTVGLLSLAMAALMLALSYPLAVWLMDEREVLTPLLVMAFAVPALALIRTISSAIRATGKVLLSQSLDGVAYTGLTAVVFAAAWLAGIRLADPVPSIVFMVCANLVLVAGAFAIWRIGREWPAGAHAVSLRSGVRIATIYVLGFLVDWIAIVALGAWDGSAAAGIYRVAAQFGLLFMLVRNSFDQMAGAHLARAYAHGSVREMVAMARRISVLGTVICLPVLAVILLAPRWLMGLFGPEFETGATALMILACAQFAGVVAGPIGSILDMSHREQVTMRIEIGVAAVAIALQVALIPRYGIEGAAIAILAAIILRSSTLLIAVSRLQANDDRGPLPTTRN